MKIIIQIFLGVLGVFLLLLINLKASHEYALENKKVEKVESEESMFNVENEIPVFVKNDTQKTYEVIDVAVRILDSQMAIQADKSKIKNMIKAAFKGDKIEIDEMVNIDALIFQYEQGKLKSLKRNSDSLAMENMR